MMAYKERNLEDTSLFYFADSRRHPSPKLIPPDICYPDFRNGDFNNNIVPPTSSPIGFQQARNSFEPSVYIGGWDQAVSEVFECQKHCEGLYSQELPTHLYQENYQTGSEGYEAISDAMEETFREALIQYFSQVDKEKEGLADDLKKLKDDFNKYVSEGKRYKHENVQQAKIIRKLTENGKFFVQEIERLKVALRQTDEQKGRLLKENVGLRKKVLYEEDIIPHLENELKSLAEENNFLKLLAEDTKQLEEQEVQIQEYKTRMQEQQQHLNIYAHEVEKLTHHLNALNQANSELKNRITELNQYKSEVEVLREKEKQLKERTKENENLIKENKQYENEINNLHATINELQKDLGELKTSSSNLSKKYMKQQETTKEKNNRISELKEKLSDLETIKHRSEEKINYQENQIRELGDTIVHLRKDNKCFVEEISQLKMENESMICEDEIRTKDYENLIKKLEIIEEQFNNLSKKERKNESEINEKNELIENLSKKEDELKEKVKRQQQENADLTEKCYRLEMKCSQLQNREEELEREILVQVKSNSELEQEIKLLNKTLDSMKKSNDSCVNQRANLQKEVLLLQQKVSSLELSEKEAVDREKNKVQELNLNEERLIQTEDQKSRLQKEILQIQERLCKTEDDVKGYEENKRKLESCMQETSQLRIENENLHGELIYFKDQNKLLKFESEETEELKLKLDQYENEAADLKFQLIKSESRVKHLENDVESHKFIRDKNFDLQNENLHLKEENLDFIRKMESLEFENKKLFEFKKLLHGCKTEKLLLLEENLILKEKVFSQAKNTQEFLHEKSFAPDIDDILQNKAMLEERLELFHEENLSLKEDIIAMKQELASKEISRMKNQNNHNDLINENKSLKLEIEELRNENIKLLEEIQHRFRSKKEQEEALRTITNIKAENSVASNFISEEKISFLKSQNKGLEQRSKSLELENSRLVNILKDLQSILDDTENDGKKNVCESDLKERFREILGKHTEEKQQKKVRPQPSYQVLNDPMSSRDTLSPLTQVSLQGNESERSPLLKESADDLINFDSEEKALNNSSITEIATDIRSENDTAIAADMQSENETVIENVPSNIEDDKNFKNVNQKISERDEISIIKTQIDTSKVKHEVELKKTYREESSSAPITFSKDENSFLCSSDIVDQKGGESEWKASGEFARPLKRDNRNENSNIQNVNKHGSSNEEFESGLFKDESKPMNLIIHNLEEENKNLQEDIDNLLKDYQILKNNLSQVESDLENREREIEDLVDNLQNKHIIIDDLQSHIKDLERDIDDGNAIEFKELVSDKNSQIAQLQVDISKLANSLQAKEKHIEEITQELDTLKNSDNQGNLVSRSQLKLPLPNVDIQKTNNQRFLKLPIPGRGNQIKVNEFDDHNEPLNKVGQPGVTKYSASNEDIDEIKEDLIKKDNLIRELEDFIKDLQENINDSNLVSDCMDASPKKQVKFQLNLQLPKPVKSPQKTNLPAIPVPKKYPENLSPDISPGEVDFAKMSRDYRSSPNDVRRRMVNLNSELLQKKIDINKLEDELKITKKNQIRAEESYRNVSMKNDMLEHELHETRRKVKEIQTKQSLNDIVDKEKKREIQNHKMGLEALERKCGMLVDENTNLLSKISQKEKAVRSLEDTCESLTMENKQLKNANEMLDGEIQNLSDIKEKYEFEISTLKEELMNLEITLKKIENENHSLKTKSRVRVTNLNDLKNENSMVTQNLLDVSEENEKLKTNLNICENERNIYEINLKEKDRMIEDLKESLRESNDEKLMLKKERSHLENLVHRNNTNKREVLSERTMLDTSVRHLEVKIEELRENLLEKEEIIFQMKKERNVGEEDIARCNMDLNHRSREIKTLQDRLDNESLKYAKLEKLNDEMNEENKKLMHEILILKENLDNSGEQTTKDREKLMKLEKEQKNLDNIVLKTQKSNGELLETNQTLNRENSVLRNNIDQLTQQLNTRTNELEKLDQKLRMIEDELSQANRCLINENKDLIDELNVARNAINDFEGILDQGQMDFDELESQLESYRKENIDLDQRLHELLKNEMKLQSEKESLERRFEHLNNDYNELREKNQQYLFENKKMKNTFEETEMKNQEYKTRDRYFEERFKGLESIIKTKEELIQNDKNEKEKLQNNVLNLQSELIALKNINEKLLHEKEATKNDNLIKRSEIEHLEKSSLNLSSEKEDLLMQLNEKSKLLKEFEEKYKLTSQERDELETLFRDADRKLNEVENELENEKLKYHEEKESYLVEISSLKRKMTEYNVDVEKQQYKQQTQENEIKELQEIKEQLEKQMEIQAENSDKEKEMILESMNKMKVQLQMVEQEKQNQMMQIKAEMEVYEESRNQDTSLLKLKLKEVEELKQIVNKEHSLSNKKDNEMESLKEDIMQLQSHIDGLEMENDELKQNIKHANSKNLALEKENHNYSLENSRLLSDVENKEERIRMFEEQRNVEKTEKQNIRNEKEKLERSYDILIEEKDLNSHKQENEIRSLRQQLKSMEVIKDENEKLRLDVESLMNERRGLQGRSAENTAEVRNLRQELREKEARYAESVDKVRRENNILKRQNDELFKQNQDLELRNANIYRTKPKHTLYFETGTRADPAFLMRQRSQSQENISDTGLEGDNFSPNRNAVATSTPTQETNRFTSSVVTKPATSQQKMSTFEPSTYSVKDPKSELSGRPTIRHIAEHASILNQNDQQKNEDGPSWVQNNEDIPLSGSIKMNPFFQKDMSAKQTWKGGVKAATSPVKTSDTITSAPKPILVNRPSFDMRPRSTDVSNENIMASGKQSPVKSLNVGSEFVNRLKAAFETK